MLRLLRAGVLKSSIVVSPGRVSSVAPLYSYRTTPYSHPGIAKLFSSGRMQPDPNPLGGHLVGIVCPEAERISPCMTIGVGSEAIAAGFEDGVDLVIGGEEPLCLPE